ncbi:hypothetical protein BGX28_008328 [Mortierella sp. GBA30]|nr:hypothetical protein BGX28_008328 [Mortierella sp. GBA30]
MKPVLLSLFPALLAVLLQHVCANNPPQTTQQLLEQAKYHLNKGEHHLALQSYDAAIDQDPSNYLAYVNRAAAYLTLGRNNQALADLTTLLDFKPDFDQALLQRGKIYMRLGEFENAKKDLKRFLENNGRKSSKNDKQQQQEEQGIRVLLSEIDKASRALKLASKAMIQDKNPAKCIQILGSAIQLAPVYGPFRRQRANCHLALGDVEEAVQDLSNLAQHNAGAGVGADSSELLHRLSIMTYYSLYRPDQALAQVKQCITFDPENKLCKALFKTLKGTEKEIAKLDSDLQKGRWAGVINKVLGEGGSGKRGQSMVKIIELETRNMEKENDAVGKMPKRLLLKVFSAACKAYTETTDTSNAIKWCTSAISLDGSNVDGLIGRGTAHMLNEDFEDAIRDFTKAQELAGGQDRKIHEKLSRAQRLLKQSRKKDYYKILGVSRTANEREIKRAYRKQAKEWHPDTYRGDVTPEQAERKMAAINEAYEVLSNPELRARFDDGDDPNESQQARQQGPFEQGFDQQQQQRFFFQRGQSPFGQDGEFRYKFHF